MWFLQAYAEHCTQSTSTSDRPPPDPGLPWLSFHAQHHLILLPSTAVHFSGPSVSHPPFSHLPCLHSKWWGSLSFPFLTCPHYLVNTMLWLVNGEAGGFLFPSQQIFVQLGSWMSAWGPKLVVCIVPLHCLYGQNRNTAAPEQRTMGRGVRCGEGRYFSAVVWLE